MNEKGCRDSERLPTAREALEGDSMDICLLMVEALQRESVLLQWWQMALMSDVTLLAVSQGKQPQGGVRSWQDGLGNIKTQQLWALEQAISESAANAEKLSNSVGKPLDLGRVGILLDRASGSARDCIALASQVIPVHQSHVVPALQRALGGRSHPNHSSYRTYMDHE